MPSKTPFRIHPGPGFSLPELLVIIVILGVIGAVGIGSFLALVRRARVQSVALEAAGWIEQVRNVAANQVSEIPTEGGCVVEWTPSSGMSANDTLASIENANCATALPEDSLNIPQTVQQDTVSVSLGTGSPSKIIFTPRGVWTNESGNLGLPFQVNIALDGGGPLRCVRLTPTLGSVELGRPVNSSDCTNWQTL